MYCSNKLNDVVHANDKTTSITEQIVYILSKISHKLSNIINSNNNNN